jgi:DNA gyrase subunit B
MATALETGVGVHFDYERLRYKRIVLMADADADGGHITMLWLAAIWNMFPDILRKGHVYVAMPPLFSVYDHKAKSRVYFYDNAELANWAKGRTKESFTATRFKGLGEMSADDLRETAMNPHTRRLRQVEVSDIGELKTLIDDLMGKSPEKRRAFMDEHARGATTREDVDTTAIGV